jgi:hypothetical protein
VRDAGTSGPLEARRSRLFVPSVRVLIGIERGGSEMVHYIVNVSQGIRIATSVTTNTTGGVVEKSFYLDWKIPALFIFLIIFTIIILILKHFLIILLEKFSKTENLSSFLREDKEARRCLYIVVSSILILVLTIIIMCIYFPTSLEIMGDQLKIP